METDVEILLDLIGEVLGEPKKSYHSHLQYGYDCPICDEDKHKGNLEVSLEKFVYHCWSCGISGTLGKLFDLCGNKKQKKLYKLLRPEDTKVREIKKPKPKLPENFVLFKDSPKVYPIRRQAYNYLSSRGITDEMIDRYSIGFCDKGSHAGRIVVPSYDSKGELNYYVARSWDKHTKAKYKNPEAEKNKIIFNESLIDWTSDIYLVEGVFDMFFLKNSIPLLGKFLSEGLFNKLYNDSKGNIIVALDGDAWVDARKIYDELNGGNLYGRIKLVKLPKDKDICDLRGQIDEFYYIMK